MSDIIFWCLLANKLLLPVISTFLCLIWLSLIIPLKCNYKENCYFFSFQKSPTFIGATHPAKICDKNFAGGVALVCNYYQICSHYFHVSKFPKYFKARIYILLSLFFL